MPAAADDADWPDPADLLLGLRATTDLAVAADWAGELVVAIDRAVGQQVAALLADPRLAALETAWRGLARITAVPAADVRVADATAIDRGDVEWLDRLLFAGPIDTRGGQPIALLVVPELIDAAVAERALCPMLTDGPTVDLRPAVGAAWFADAPAVPLAAATGHSLAAAAAASVAAFGWPIDVPAADGVARQFMAARFAQAVAVWCRDRPLASPAAVEAAVADHLRGRFVGPRLPLRSADVSATATGAGDVAVTLRLAPRLGGDDRADAVVTVRLTVRTGT